MKLLNLYKHAERLSELLKVGTRQAGAHLGLQPVQVEVLNYLVSCNKYSDTSMAVTEYLGQTKGTVSQTIKILEKKGLIEKKLDIKDKRISHLKVTPLGASFLDEHIPSSMFINACENLSSAQQQDILMSLKLLLESIAQANSMKSFGICRTCRYNNKNADNTYYCHLLKQTLMESETHLICREHEQVN